MKRMLLITILTLMAFIFSNARGNTDPKINPPENVTIAYSDSTVTIGWDAVPNTLKYYIYTQSDPYGVFALVDSTVSTTWNGNFTVNKNFFQISAKEIPSLSVMVYVQGGTFNMGDHYSEGDSDELPLHSVTLSDYYIGATEVTQKEWTDIMGSIPSTGYGEGDTYPLYWESWYAALRYCNLRSMAEGITPCYTISSSTDPADWGELPTATNAAWNAAICNWSANGYRLPSEAEWEYAARGGIHNADNYHYSGSDTIDEVAWYDSNSGSKTHIVSTKAANQLGLYDMSGNLWEWCWDWVGSYMNDAQTNPTGPTTGTYRIGRGGSWYNNASYSRVASRGVTGYPQTAGRSVGFRLSRTP